MQQSVMSGAERYQPENWSALEPDERFLLVLASVLPMRRAR